MGRYRQSMSRSRRYHYTDGTQFGYMTGAHQAKLGAEEYLKFKERLTNNFYGDDVALRDNVDSMVHRIERRCVIKDGMLYVKELIDLMDKIKREHPKVQFVPRNIDRLRLGLGSPAFITDVFVYYPNDFFLSTAVGYRDFGRDTYKMMYFVQNPMIGTNSAYLTNVSRGKTERHALKKLKQYLKPDDAFEILRTGMARMCRMVRENVSVEDETVFVEAMGGITDFTRTGRDMFGIHAHLSAGGWAKFFRQDIVMSMLAVLPEEEYVKLDDKQKRLIDSALNFDALKDEALADATAYPDMLAVYMLPNAPTGDSPLCLSLRVNDYVLNPNHGLNELHTPRICRFDELPDEAQSGMLMVSKQDEETESVEVPHVGSREGPELFYVLCSAEGREEWKDADE